jgi:hypothetical protein
LKETDGPYNLETAKEMFEDPFSAVSAFNSFNVENIFPFVIV